MYSTSPSSKLPCNVKPVITPTPWPISYCETLKFGYYIPTNHEMELDFSPPITTIVKLLFILSFQTWFITWQTSSEQMGFKMHISPPCSTLRLIATPRTKNSTSMGLGSNNFPPTITIITTMTTSVQFETLASQMGPCCNASVKVGYCRPWLGKQHGKPWTFLVLNAKFTNYCSTSLKSPIHVMFHELTNPFSSIFKPTSFVFTKHIRG